MRRDWSIRDIVDNGIFVYERSAHPEHIGTLQRSVSTGSIGNSIKSSTTFMENYFAFTFKLLDLSRQLAPLIGKIGIYAGDLPVAGFRHQALALSRLVKHPIDS
jgi:hypothetical protein